MPEVLTTAELEGFVAGLVPEPLEPAFGAAAVGCLQSEDRVCAHNRYYVSLVPQAALEDPEG